MIEAAAARPDVALMFSDEDKLDPSGRRTAPFFKPAWDDEWIRTTNCVLHLTVVRTDLLRQLGGIATGVDGAQDWDLVLRVREQAGPSRIAHVPRVLYHWREGKGSTAAAAFEKPALVQAQADVLARSLLRRGDDADAVVTDARVADRVPVAFATAARLGRHPVARPRRPPSGMHHVASRPHDVSRTRDHRRRQRLARCGCARLSAAARVRPARRV